MSGAILPLPLRAIMKCVGTNLLYSCHPKYHSQSQTARPVLCFFGYWSEVYRDFAQCAYTNGGIYYLRLSQYRGYVHPFQSAVHWPSYIPSATGVKDFEMTILTQF